MWSPQFFSLLKRRTAASSSAPALQRGSVADVRDSYTAASLFPKEHCHVVFAASPHVDSRDELQTGSSFRSLCATLMVPLRRWDPLLRWRERASPRSHSLDDDNTNSRAACATSCERVLLSLASWCDKARLWRWNRRKRRARVLVAALLAILCVLMLTVGPRRMVVGLLTRVASSRRRSSPVKDDVPRGPMRLPISILVQHDGVAQRLKHAFDHPHWPPPNCSTDSAFCSAARDGAPVAAGAATDGDVGGRGPRLSRDMVPSWTLQTVDADCADCVDHYAYDLAVRDVQLRGRRGVFALSRSPRGMLGPMLLAMSSVTDDVDVATELPQWGWLRHVYPNFPAALRSQPPRRRPYLAVMGVPSTDQPARLALRDAQRATWMSYHEVARNENAFEGALLPLYVVAAGKRRRVGAMGAEGVDSARPPVCGDPSPLLPTPEELNVASRVLLEERNGPRTTSFTRHYVSLGEGWRTLQDGASARSPCIGAFTVREPDSTHVSYAAAMGEVLQLSVTPAFVSPAQFVCCVSARLWREALEHRNLIWVDMMTDRRPTTNKALGQDGGWGLPVEVGMTQKTVLWLEYAYHAFPDVPYIMKGDDDTYLKVPQFMSDLRYVQGGLRHRFPPPPPPSASASAAARAAADQREEGYGAVDKLGRPFTAETSECLYWGSLRHHEHTQFNAGMLYLLHRRVAQAVLEPTQNRSRLDVVRLSAEDFTADRSAAYRVLLYDHEDIFMGLRVYDALDRIKALCPNGRLWYVKEWYARFHDLHAGRVHNLTWSTVVAHRCRPADSYFLHHFFQTEYAVSVLRGVGVADVEAAARRGAVEWIAEQLRRGEARQEDGWDTLPVARWSRDLAKTPGFTVAPVDKVAVYEIPYEYWRHGPTTIEDGYRSQPQW